MGLFGREIPLDPGAGGCSIGEAALQMADIIVSTTDAGVSRGIRVGTGSAVSHAAMYDGAGMIIESLGHGVEVHPIATALADDTLAVAYRLPDLDEIRRRRIVEWALRQRGVPYSVAGAVLSTDKILCRLAGPRPGAFFCSQLVFEAYRQAGAPLTTLPPQCVTPADAVEIAQHHLAYVGHLKGSLTRFPVVGG
jgi:uncharacterized protein YycO